ncbi:polysaccharide biosynthesis tyrosine autokinase [Nocardia sp. BMG111209]|uniref:polysaccharide biosynthesis tyrosine autokinase n=1 Tax=Nocardia sp. BMG111209 TaxID=1160137 RepID=UPI00037AE819|nr:polysaccharide biosynthesis tyrosine autokinase [Nocardia sp. BMG111209]
MGLIDFWHLAKRRWPIIAVIFVICVGASYGYLRTLPVTYTASSTCYVTMATGTSVNDSYQGGLAAQQRVRSYVDLVTSETVARRVRDQLALNVSTDDLRSRITVTSPPATTLVQISVSDPTATGARQLTNEVVSQFRALVDQLETIQSDAAPAARVAVVDQAQLPSAPSGPQSKRILVLGILAGLVLGLFAAIGRHRLDRRLRTSHDVASLLTVPVLAHIEEGRPSAAGELRRLRTRLTDDRRIRSVLLAPLSPQSRPEIAIGLAQTLGDAGSRVVLVDADTTGQGSSVHLTLQSATGLSELLRLATPLDDAVLPWEEAGIWVLPVGAIDKNTPDLLASRRFGDIMAKLRSEFDHIVLECAPVATAADAVPLARNCDTTLGVVELGRTTSPQVTDALTAFGPDDPRLGGVVVYTHPKRRRGLPRRPGGATDGK